MTVPNFNKWRKQIHEKRNLALEEAVNVRKESLRRQKEEEESELKKLEKVDLPRKTLEWKLGQIESSRAHDRQEIERAYRESVKYANSQFKKEMKQFESELKVENVAKEIKDSEVKELIDSVENKLASKDADINKELDMREQRWQEGRKKH